MSQQSLDPGILQALMPDSAKQGSPRLANLAGAPHEDQPDYIKRRAEYLYNKNEYVDPMGDVWVNKYLQFYRDFVTATIDDIPFLQSVHGPIYNAHHLLTNDDLRFRVVEAGIIGRATAGQIASYIGTDPETIVAYETCFYRVRDQLDNPGYVFGNLLAPVLEFDAIVSVSDSIWKAVAYTGLWSFFCNFLEGVNKEEIMGAIVDLIRVTEGRKILYAVHKERLNSDNIPLVLQRYVKQIGGQQVEDDTISLLERVEYSKIEESMKNLSLVPAMVENAEDTLVADEVRRLPAGLDHMKKLVKEKVNDTS